MSGEAQTKPAMQDSVDAVTPKTPEPQKMLSDSVSTALLSKREPQDTEIPAKPETQDAQMPVEPEPQGASKAGPLSDAIRRFEDPEDHQMLSDGSNPEFVDPSLPLAWKSKDDLTDVVVYGPPASPPVCKVCAILIFCKVPFKRVSKGKRKTPYKKVPVLDAGGRQVNDSTVILKHICPALGVEFDNAWNTKISTVWDATFRKNVNDTDAGKLAGRLSLPCYCFGSFLGGSVAKALNAQFEANSKANSAYQSHPSNDLVEPCKEFKAEFKGAFHGGETPDTVDVLVFGFLAPGVYAACDMFIAALLRADLRDWNTAMQGQIPYEQLFFGRVRASE